MGNKEFEAIWRAMEFPAPPPKPTIAYAAPVPVSQTQQSQEGAPQIYRPPENAIIIAGGEGSENDRFGKIRGLLEHCIL